MNAKNALPLSPMTIDACVRRITSDLHPTRWDSAACVALAHLAYAATGGLDAFGAEMAIRCLAELADPDGYAEAVRQTLGEEAAAYL